jgi:hypothetical protein
MVKDMDCVEVAFVANNTEISLKTTSIEEIETALMCILNRNIVKKDLPIFNQGYCYNLDYVKKFWEYFNVHNKWDSTCYVGLFITALCVRGHNVDMFCERLVTENRNGREKRHRTVPTCSESIRRLEGYGR